jgi:hypothetical protein
MLQHENDSTCSPKQNDLQYLKEQPKRSPTNLIDLDKKQQFNNNFEMKIVQSFVILSLFPEDIQKYF